MILSPLPSTAVYVPGWRGRHTNGNCVYGYVLTAQYSREFRVVTDGDVPKRSECEKHDSRRTVVKLRYVRYGFVILPL